MLWGAVFVPAILRARRDTSPIASVGTFRRGMRALGGRTSSSAGRWILVPPKAEDIERTKELTLARRRKVFTALAGAAIATLLLGMFPALRGLLKLHLAVDLILAGYVVLLLQMKQRAPTRRQVTEERPERSFAQAGHF